MYSVLTTVPNGFIFYPNFIISVTLPSSLFAIKPAQQRFIGTNMTSDVSGTFSKCVGRARRMVSVNSVYMILLQQYCYFLIKNEPDAGIKKGTGIMFSVGEGTSAGAAPAAAPVH